MKYQHKHLANGRWLELSLPEQLANIGSEIERTMSWRGRNEDYSDKAFGRALELLDLTLADPKNKTKLKELARLREALVDSFKFDNLYGSTDKLWKNYFFSFNYLARNSR